MEKAMENNRDGEIQKLLISSNMLSGTTTMKMVSAKILCTRVRKATRIDS